MGVFATEYTQQVKKAVETDVYTQMCVCKHVYAVSCQMIL